MMFRRRNKKGSTSDLHIDSSSHSIKNNSKHNAKYNLSQSLPELRRSISLVSTTQKPIRGILRITSVEDSLHSVYGKDGVQSSSRRTNSCPPDFDLSVRSSQSDDMIIRQNGTLAARRRQSVLFKAIEIREYERTVGDNPSCSSGPPVSISWDYYPQVKKLPLDDYENYRPNRRSSYEMILSREIRDSMLRKEWDVSRAEIAAAIRDTIKVKNQRRQTVQNLNKDKVEEMFEGASKKIFRSLMFKSSTTQELDMLNQQYNAVQALRQQEMKLAKEQQQQYGNDDTFISTSLSGRDVVDSLIVVGMSIDDDEIVEDLDDDDDDDTEHKEDLPNTKETSNTKASKKPILIEEDDNDAALLMNVRSVKTHTYTATAMVDTGITPLPDRTAEVEQQQQQHQCKGENSSEDGSTNNNNNMNHSSHHHTVKNHNNSPPPNDHNHHTTTNARTMAVTKNIRTTTEI